MSNAVTNPTRLGFFGLLALLWAGLFIVVGPLFWMALTLDAVYALPAAVLVLPLCWTGLLAFVGRIGLRRFFATAASLFLVAWLALVAQLLLG